jgi:hypothetical protein
MRSNHSSVVLRKKKVDSAGRIELIALEPIGLAQGFPAHALDEYPMAQVKHVVERILIEKCVATGDDFDHDNLLWGPKTKLMPAIGKSHPPDLRGPVWGCARRNTRDFRR